MGLLLSILVAILILVVIYVVIQRLGAIFSVDAKIMQVVQLIFMVIALIFILRIIGVWGGGPYVIWGR